MFGSEIECVWTFGSEVYCVFGCLVRKYIVCFRYSVRKYRVRLDIRFGSIARIWMWGPKIERVFGYLAQKYCVRLDIRFENMAGVGIFGSLI